MNLADEDDSEMSWAENRQLTEEVHMAIYDLQAQRRPLYLQLSNNLNFPFLAPLKPFS